MTLRPKDRRTAADVAAGCSDPPCDFSGPCDNHDPEFRRRNETELRRAQLRRLIAMVSDARVAEANGGTIGVGGFDEILAELAKVIP
jgi:hypothetical protein